MHSRQLGRHLPRLQEAYERPCGDRCSCDAPYSIRRQGIATELPLYALQVAERPSLFGPGSPPGTGEQENGAEERAGLGPAHEHTAGVQPAPVGAGLRPALGKLLAAWMNLEGQLH